MFITYNPVAEEVFCIHLEVQEQQNQGGPEELVDETNPYTPLKINHL